MEKSTSSITGSFNLSQRVNRKHFFAENDLRLVKRNDKRVFTLISRNSFGRRPDILLVAGEENVSQSLGSTDFRSTTETKFGKLTRFWKYYLTAGIDLNYHRMKNTLSGLVEYDNHGDHEAFLSNFFASPQIDFERNGWRVSLSIPMKWYHYNITKSHNYINISPRLFLRRQLDARSELSGSVAYRLVSPQPYLNINDTILSDYRNLFIANNPDKYSHDVATTLSYRYRNPVKSLFVNLSATYNYRRSHIMSNQIFIDDFIVSTYAEKISGNKTWYLKGGLSKGIGHSKMVAGIEGNVSLTSASSMRDNSVVPYRQTTTEIKPYIKGSILRWLSANYEAEYGFSKLDINGDGNTCHTFHQNLFATILPNDLIEFTIGAEHFLTNFSEGNTANLILLDASAVWRVSNKIRLSLTANNLLNKQNYEYVTYGTLSRSEHFFNIRQRSILASVQYRF